VVEQFVFGSVYLAADRAVRWICSFFGNRFPGFGVSADPQTSTTMDMSGDVLHCNNASAGIRRASPDGCFGHTDTFTVLFY